MGRSMASGRRDGEVFVGCMVMQKHCIHEHE